MVLGDRGEARALSVLIYQYGFCEHAKDGPSSASRQYLALEGIWITAISATDIERG